MSEKKKINHITAAVIIAVALLGWISYKIYNYYELKELREEMGDRYDSL